MVSLAHFISNFRSIDKVQQNAYPSEEENYILESKIGLTSNAKELTGSELVRKYVTFHFFFPVGQHHPAAGNPLLTRENGLLDYQANCDKVSGSFIISFKFPQKIIFILSFNNFLQKLS